MGQRSNIVSIRQFLFDSFYSELNFHHTLAHGIDLSLFVSIMRGINVGPLVKDLSFSNSPSILKKYKLHGQVMRRSYN